MVPSRAPSDSPITVVPDMLAPEAHIPKTLSALRAAAVAAALGVVAYAIIDATPWFASVGVPSGAVQLLWMLFVMVASGLCGWLHPVRSWRWAAILLAVQPIIMLLVTLVRGEPDATHDTIPARTSVFIASVFVATVSPFALIAAAAMASKRKSESR